MPDVGYYALPIIPSFDGIEGTINTELTAALGGRNAGVAQGRAIGGNISRGIVDGVKAAEAAVEKQVAAVAKLKQKEADAIGKVAVAEAKLQELRDKGVTGSRLLAAEESRNRLLRQQESITSELRRETDRLTRSRADLANAQRDALNNPATEEAAEEGGDDAGGAWMAGFAGKLKGLAGKGGAIGLALVAAVGAVAGPAAMMANEVMASFDREVNLDKIQAALRLTDDEIEGLKESSTNLYGNNFGADLTDVQDSMASVASAFDLQGEALERLSGQAITFRDIYGTEIAETMSNAQALISQGLADSPEQAMDLLAASFAAVPEMMRDEIGPLAREYGGVFAGLGFDGAEAFGMLSEAANVSEFAMDKVGDSLKEFGLLASDVSNTGLTELFESMGLDQGAVANNLLAGGDQAQQQFQEVVDKLLAIPDAGEQAAAAIALFGTPLEDLGKDNIPEFLAALSEGAQGLENFEGAAQEAVDTAGTNTAGTIESAMRQFEIGRMEMQDELAKVFAPMANDFAAWFVENKETIMGFFTEMGAGALYGAGAFVAFAGQSITVLGKFMEVLGDVVGWSADAWEEILGAMAAALDALPDSLVPDGWVEGLRGAQGEMDEFSDSAHEFGTGTTEFGMSLYGTAGQLFGYADQLHNGTIAGQEFTEAQGEAIAAIERMPDGKTFTLTDNTPEVRAELENLGFTITELPDGTITVDATTEEAEGVLASFRAGQAFDPLVIPARLDEAQIRASYDEAVRNLGLAGNAGPDDRNNRLVQDPMTGQWVVAPREFGGIYGALLAGQYGFGKLPTDAIIQPAVGGPGLVQWAEPSTHGEAFIPLAPDRRQRSLEIWAATGGLLGAFENGGVLGDAGGLLPFTSKLRALIQETWGITDIGGYRSPDGYNEHSSGRALDVMIPEWDTPGGVELGNEIAAWALNIPGVNRVMWQASLINADGTTTPVPDRGSPTANLMDHVHIFTDDVGVGTVPIAPNMLSSTGVYSSTGVGPTGAQGTYTVDPDAVSAAQGDVAEADARVRELEAKNAEVQADADAKESDKIAAENDLADAKRDAADARKALSEAQQGEFTEADTAAAETDTAPKDIASLIGDGILETFGLDGSWLPDIKNLGIVKLLNNIMGIKYTPVGDGSYTGGPGVAAPGGTGFDPMSAVTSMLPFGMIPNAADAFVDPLAPGSTPPTMPGQGTAAGVAPNVDQSTHLTVNGYSQNEVITGVHRELAWNKPRSLTYAPPGG